MQVWALLDWWIYKNLINSRDFVKKCEIIFFTYYICKKWVEFLRESI